MKREVKGWQWHQLDYMQIVCTLLQIDDHASTTSMNILQACSMLFLIPNQQCLFVKVLEVPYFYDVNLLFC